MTFQRISMMPCPWHLKHTGTMGYLEAQEDAYTRIAKGEKQIKCHVCGFWFWPDNFGIDPIQKIISDQWQDPKPLKQQEKILNTNIMTPQQQQKQERIEKLSTIVNEIITRIAEGKAIKFEELVHEHKVLWNSGVRSILSILKGKLKLIDYKERKKNTYKFTPTFEEKYNQMSSGSMIDDIAKKLFVQTEKWESRPRKDKAQLPIINNPGAISWPAAEGKGVTVTPLEKYALITHLQAYPAADMAVEMILKGFIAKLNA